MKRKLHFLFSVLMAIVMMAMSPQRLWADDEKPWLCFTAEWGNSSVKLNKNGSPAAITLETSTDGTNWTTYSFGNTITLANAGDKVYFRNQSETVATSFSKGNTGNYYNFAMSGGIAASGNVMSLLDQSCATTAFDKTNGKYAFCNLFKDCSSLTSAPELPATTLAELCYNFMFQNCKNLTVAPLLPAKDLDGWAYGSMFWGCSSLATIPSLPAETGGQECLSHFVYECTSLMMNSSAPGYAWVAPNLSALLWNHNTFEYTSGTYQNNPAAGATYYLASTPKVTLNDKGYATYSTYINAHIATAGVKAYKVVTNGEDLELTELDGDIPAGTGVLLKGTPNTTVSFTVSSSPATIAEGTNQMIPATITPCVIEARPATGYTYKLVGKKLVKTAEAFKHNSAYMLLDNDTYDVYNIVPVVATVTIDGNTTEYETIEETFTAANVADQTSTVTLKRDIDDKHTSAVLLDLTAGNITLDLNDHKLSTTCNHCIQVNGANLTIVDNGAEKKGEVSATNLGINFISGSLTINGGKFIGEDYGLNASGYTSGTITLRGGTFTKIQTKYDPDNDWSFFDMTGNGFFDTDNKLVVIPNDAYINTTVTVKDLATENAGVSVTKSGVTTYYAEVKDAFAAASTETTAEAPATVKLLSDYNYDYNLPPLTSGVMTLDLNDHCLNNDNDYGIQILGATLTIVDNGTEKKGEVSADYCGINFISGLLTINGGKFVGNGYGLNASNRTSGSIVLRGGTFTKIQTKYSPSNDWSFFDMTNYGFFDADNQFVVFSNNSSIGKTVTVKNLAVEKAGFAVTKNSETTYYIDLLNALTVAATGTAEAPVTVKLYSDYNYDPGLPQFTSGVMTIDLNDHKITTCGYAITVNGADLTIEDNGEDKTGEIHSASYAVEFISGKLTVNGGYLYGSFGLDASFATSASEGDIVLRGGKIYRIQVPSVSQNVGKWSIFNMQDGEKEYILVDDNDDKVEFPVDSYLYENVSVKLNHDHQAGTGELEHTCTLCGMVESKITEKPTWVTLTDKNGNTIETNQYIWFGTKVNITGTAPEVEGKLFTGYKMTKTNGKEISIKNNSFAMSNSDVALLSKGYIDIPSAPLCFEAKSEYAKVSFEEIVEGYKLYYSTDNKQTWNEYEYNSNDYGLVCELVNIGDKVYMFGDITSKSTGDYTKFDCGNCVVSGKLSSVLGGATTIPEYGCYHLFNDANLTSAPDMSDITAIGKAGCKEMFEGCDYLVTPPDMSNLKEIGEEGCAAMFMDDYEIKTVSDMNSLETIASYGCYGMFGFCNSLETAPNMRNLTKIGENGCYEMFQYCYALTSAPGLSSLEEIGSYGCKGMFESCVRLETAPDLSSVTTIGEYGCTSMFYGCSKLKYVKVGFNSWPTAAFATDYWLNDVAETGTFVCPCDLTVEDEDRGEDNIPTGWTVSLIHIYDNNTLAATADAETGLYSIICERETCHKAKPGVKVIKDYAPEAESNAKNLELTYDESNNSFSIDEAIALTDANQFKDLNVVFTTAAAPSYSRTMQGEWGTLVLPFAVSGAPSGFAFYGVRTLGEGGYLYLDKMTGAISAGTPVLVRRTGENTDLSLTANNSVVNTAIAQPSGVALKGLYETVSLNKADNPDDYFIYSNQLYSTRNLADGKNVSILPFHAYLVASGSSNAKLMIMVNDEATSIDGIYRRGGESGAMYNIQGQKLSAPQKGINIVNGKKIMVK